MPKFLRHLHLNRGLLACAMAVTASAGAMASALPTTLSDTPVYSTSNVPANLMLALSVEYPTGTVAAYKDSSGYSASATYLGYFDAGKCYDYSSSNGYFVPVSKTSDHTCSGHWSGNMLNWALMTSLDEFRQALTGGNRSVDTATTTVLKRSNLNSQTNINNFPIKILNSSTTFSPSSVIGDSNYSSLNTVYLFSYQQGSSFIISNNYTPPSRQNNNTPTVVNDGGANFYTVYNAQVQVCATGMLESNCNSAHASTDYVGAGSYAKPEGLIQQNYTKIRVGASAYAFQRGDTHPNGVVRALLRDNGPTKYNGYGTPLSNPNAEWDGTTGIFNTNPDSSDSTYATAPGGTAFTDSGTINYLNKFGYGNGYEQYDTVGDLYWATLAYYMQVPLDASYTTGLTQSNSMDPTFPVFTGTAVAKSTSPTVNDPIQYTCQNNAIVTIGDAHTWYDTAVPTSAPAAKSSAGTLLSPLTVGGNVGTALDASDYVTKLGNLPLIEAQGTTAASSTMAQYLNVTALGSTYEIGGEYATYNMAGLAYYAHTKDIRADITGNQKITTYTVDVLEPGIFDGSKNDPTYNPSNLTGGSSTGGAGPDMYWLAAKYGGFNDVNGDGQPANILTWHTNSTTAAANNLRPDNYFPGNQASLIQSGLQQIFNNVASTSSQSGSGLTVNSSHGLTNLTASTAPYYAPVAGFPAYTTQYTPVTWTGDVSGFIATTSTGSAVNAATGSTPWHAQLQLDTLTQATNTSSGTTSLGWDTGRRIITWNGSKGVPFRYSQLSSAEQTAVDATTHGSDFVNYLRGDKSNETKEFRARTHILGDIVNSGAVLVQSALSTSYSETNNPGYTAFASSVANRQPVVYVGANDGMLHAFEADFQSSTTTNTVTGGGSELFAYIPSLLFNGPNGTPLVDGLPALGNLNGVSTNNFAHHFYVDATPQVADVDFNYISDGKSNPIASTTGTASSPSTANWHTILVGGLGKGGKDIYALDVTSVPTAVDTSSSSTVETSQAGKVLWEFTEADMGYSFGAPLIIKTRKYGWVVAVTSGYDNTSGTLAGHGILYILNAQTGAMLQKIDTGAGSAIAPAGLTQATAFTQDVTDGTVDQIYAGDLLGNVWRFDLTESAVDSSGAATGNYPVTLFATLKDPTTKKPQPITTAPRVEESLSSNGLNILRWVFVGTGKFLDIGDLTDTQQQTMYALRDGSGSTPATSGLPLTRDSLTALTDLTKGITTLTDSSAGWYYDLTNSAGGTNGGTERIVVAPAAVTGLNIVAWTTVIPSSDPCSLQGALYATNYAGQTVLLSGGSPVTYLTTTAAPTGLSLLQNTDGTVTLASSTSAGVTTFKAVNQKGNPNQINRVNWREVLN